MWKLQWALIHRCTLLRLSEALDRSMIVVEPLNASVSTLAFSGCSLQAQSSTWILAWMHSEVSRIWVPAAIFKLMGAHAAEHCNLHMWWSWRSQWSYGLACISASDQSWHTAQHSDLSWHCWARIQNDVNAAWLVIRVARSLATLLQQYIIVDSMSFVQIPALSDNTPLVRGLIMSSKPLRQDNMTVAAIVLSSAKVWAGHLAWNSGSLVPCNATNRWCRNEARGKLTYGAAPLVQLHHN